jgi:hypothetical protein
MQRLAAQRCPTDSGGNGEAGPHGALGIGLPRFRPAKIDQHTVTYIACDEAAELSDGRSDASLIRTDDLSKIFRIEPSRKCSGADKVAEHHAERAAFGRSLGQTYVPGRMRRPITGRCPIKAQRCNRFQQAATMAKRVDTYSLEVVVR